MQTNNVEVMVEMIVFNSYSQGRAYYLGVVYYHTKANAQL